MERSKTRRIIHEPSMAYAPLLISSIGWFETAVCVSVARGGIAPLGLAQQMTICHSVGLQWLALFSASVWTAGSVSYSS